MGVDGLIQLKVMEVELTFVERALTLAGQLGTKSIAGPDERVLIPAVNVNVDQFKLSSRVMMPK